jgi:hypothetical protein
MAVVWQNTFVGSPGSSVAADLAGVSGGDPFDSMTITAPGTATYASPNGMVILATTNVAVFGQVAGLDVTSDEDWYFKITVYKTAAPPATMYLLRVLQSGGAQSFRVAITTGGLLQIQDSLNAVLWTSSGSILQGSDSRIEGRIRPSSTAADQQVEMWWYNTASGTVATEASGTVDTSVVPAMAIGASLGTMRLGNATASNTQSTVIRDAAYGSTKIGYLGGADISVNVTKVSATADVLDPFLPVSRTVTPAKVSAVAALPTATVGTGGGAAPQPGTVQAVAGIMVVQRVTAHSLLDPTAVAARTAVPIPTQAGTSTIVAAQPIRADTAVGLGSPVVSTGTARTVTPARIASTAAVSDVTLAGGSAATTTPATVAAAATVNAPRATSTTVQFAATTIPTAAAVGAVVIELGTASYLFRPPIRNPEGPRVTVVPNPTTIFNDNTPQSHALMRHFRHHGGHPVAVLVTGGVVTEKQVPTTAEIQAADYTFLGGRDHVVTGDMADLLTAAGYELLTI